jgi:hypothetical protein
VCNAAKSFSEISYPGQDERVEQDEQLPEYLHVSQYLFPNLAMTLVILIGWVCRR